ncbi:MAG TPA: type II toxin-antitoxin system RelE/ParE family toxin [Dehalococcoidia bacterium]|nr:type II toxin-antitoxin system RelE/ParE family toxin [Dehalococcoidia bacterium]
MEIEFADRKLERAFEEPRFAIREWGVAIARKYAQRVQTMLDTTSFETIEALRSFRGHELKGELAGLWAIDLNDKWRLIIEVSEDGNTVRVVEVIDHYGD